MKLLRETILYYEAELLKEILENEGIPVEFRATNVSFMDKVYFGAGAHVDIYVPDELFGSASKILLEMHSKGSETVEMGEPKKTPLYDEHVKLGGKIVDFAGWSMPVQYSSILDEHSTVRNAAGLFDVSHMGEVEITGKEAIAFSDFLVTNSVSKLKDGEICYTPMCNERGGIVDDVLVYKISDEKTMFVVNASNSDKDYQWIVSHKGEFQVDIVNKSSEMCQIAIQGPKAEEILSKITEINLPEIPFYSFEYGKVDGTEALVSRTGYTGEDGFEIYAAAGAAVSLWKKLIEVGTDYGLKPAGLGARDSLRFEACYMLYGNELSDDISPLEAGLKWATKLEKEFVGVDVLRNEKETGLPFRLRGLELIDKGIARHGYEIFSGEEKIGWISSGLYSPTLEKALALAYINRDYWKLGNEVEIQIRNKRVKARIIKTPFYRGSVKSR